MSKGTKGYYVRIPDDLMDLIEEEISKRNAHSDATPWTLAEFIRVMVLRGIRHRHRARKEGVNLTPLKKVEDSPILYE